MFKDGLLTRFKEPIMERPSKSTIVSKLCRVFPHKKWFIAGSFAMPGDKYNDIDVFFESEEAYKEAMSSIDPTLFIYGTTNAQVMQLYGLKVQLITRHFGTIDEIFGTFDLNICQQAILPNLIHRQSIKASSTLHIINPNYATFHRFLKYVNKLEYDGATAKKVIKRAIDTYISDSSTSIEYYNNEETLFVVNAEMYKVFKNHIHSGKLKEYLYDQAKIHSPELLL